MEEKLRFRENSELVFARGIHRCNFKHPLLLDTVTSKAGLANRKRGAGGRSKRKKKRGTEEMGCQPSQDLD